VTPQPILLFSRSSHGIVSVEHIEVVIANSKRMEGHRNWWRRHYQKLASEWRAYNPGLCARCPGCSCWYSHHDINLSAIWPIGTQGPECRPHCATEGRMNCVYDHQAPVHAFFDIIRTLLRPPPETKLVLESTFITACPALFTQAKGLDPEWLVTDWYIGRFHWLDLQPRRSRNHQKNVCLRRESIGDEE